MALSRTISLLIAVTLLLIGSDQSGGAGALEENLRRSLHDRDLSARAELGMRVAAPRLAGFLQMTVTPEAPHASRNASVGSASQTLARRRELVLAAALLAPHCEDAWSLLVPLARAASTPDRPIAAAASLSAAEIARGLTADVLAKRDAPDDLIAGALRAWQDIAGSAHRWADVRVHALAIAKTLSELAHQSAAKNRDSRPHGYDLAVFAADSDPEVRRAAFELLPRRPDGEALAIAAGAVASESDPRAALAAAQAICGGLAFGDPAAPILAALGQEGMSRLRELVSRPATLPPAALLDSARCLAADGNPGSMAALRALQSRSPRYVRQRVRSLSRQRR